MVSGYFKKEKGFTLLEVLIVLVILSIIAMIATINVSSALKRSRLEAAGNQVQSFVESASIYAREKSRGVFVWLHNAPAPGGGGGNWWYCYLIEDTNRNDTLDYQIINPNAVPPGAGTAADGDNYIMSEKVGIEGGVALPSDIVIANTNQADPTSWGGRHTWPVPNAFPDDYLLLCDPRALAFNPNSGTQIMQPSIISLTHIEMLDDTGNPGGSLHPNFRFDLTVSPLWHTKLDKVLY